MRHRHAPPRPPSAPADPADPTRILDNEQRGLGLVVCRGPNITVLAPEDGMVSIENPFQAEAEE